ncbi:unnamed protein product, partial [Musa textilis]
WRENSACGLEGIAARPCWETADKPRNVFITLHLEAILKPIHLQAIDLSSSRSIFEVGAIALISCLIASVDQGFRIWASLRGKIAECEILRSRSHTIAFSCTSSSAIQVVFCSVRESRLPSQFFRCVVLPETMIPSFLILDSFKDTSLLVYRWQDM